MGTWADRAFQRLKTEEGARHTEIQREVQRRNQILTEAPDRWRELKDALRAEVGDFNQYRSILEFNGSDPSDHATLISPKREIDLTFSSAHPKISYTVSDRTPSAKTRNKSGTFSFLIDAEQVWLADDVTPMDVEAAAALLLDALL
jgi:hypothetical protein